MGEVVELQTSRDARAHDAWLAFLDLKRRADATLTIRDMAAAVRAFESFLALSIPNERERAEVLR